MFVPPLPREAARRVVIEKGPNIASLPTFAPLSDTIEGPVLLKVGDDVSTDEIMPAGTRVLPFRSNIPRIAEFSFDIIDPTYAARAKQTRAHVVVGGSNYGQGSSREAPRTAERRTHALPVHGSYPTTTKLAIQAATVSTVLAATTVHPEA